MVEVTEEDADAKKKKLMENRMWRLLAEEAARRRSS